MSRQGTWADHIIIQAVADAMNLKIHIRSYLIDNKYTLFRNDASTTDLQNTRPFGGTAVYSCVDFYPGYPYCFNRNGAEITV